MIKSDLSSLLAGLVGFEQATREKISGGLEQGAIVAEAMLKATIAHGDMSTATRESYTAYVYGEGHELEADAIARERFEVAAAMLEGFTDHDGQPYIEGFSIEGNRSMGIVLTSFTDYQVELEESRKATLGPTIEQIHQEITTLVEEFPIRKR